MRHCYFVDGELKRSIERLVYRQVRDQAKVTYTVGAGQCMYLRVFRCPVAPGCVQGRADGILIDGGAFSEVRSETGQERLAHKHDRDRHSWSLRGSAIGFFGSEGPARNRSLTLTTSKMARPPHYSQEMRCSRCGRVSVPPQKTCIVCFFEAAAWVNVSTDGVLPAHAWAQKPSPIIPLSIR